MMLLLCLHWLGGMLLLGATGIASVIILIGTFRALFLAIDWVCRVIP